MSAHTAAATDTHHVNTPNTGAAAPAPLIPRIPRHFLESAGVPEAYRGASDQYDALCDSLEKAHTALHKFEAKCTQSRPGTLSLPASMTVNLLERARFDTQGVPSDFYAAEKKLIADAQSKAIAATYAAVTQAKQHYIAHLLTLLVPNTFVEQATPPFEKLLDAWFARHKDPVMACFDLSSEIPAAAAAAAAPAPTEQRVDGFTRAQYVRHFHAKLRSEINRLTAKRRQRLSDALAKRERSMTDDAAAQETVQAGATTGETIARLSKLHVEEALKEKLKKQQQQKMQVARRLGAAPTQYAAASSSTAAHRRSTTTPAARRPSGSVSMPVFTFPPCLFTATSPAAASVPVPVPELSKQQKRRLEKQANQLKMDEQQRKAKKARLDAATIIPDDEDVEMLDACSQQSVAGSPVFPIGGAPNHAALSPILEGSQGAEERM